MTEISVVDNLAFQLQSLPDESAVSRVEEVYQKLKKAFAQLLFGCHKAPPDHYAWLLLNHDASCSLERLVAAYDCWQQALDSTRAERAYQQELTDFRWLIATALSCKP